MDRRDMDIHFIEWLPMGDVMHGTASPTFCHLFQVINLTLDHRSLHPVFASCCSQQFIDGLSQDPIVVSA